MKFRTSYKNVKTKPSYDDRVEAPRKRTKIQILQARKTEALALQRQMQSLNNQHTELVNNWEKTVANQKKLGKRRVDESYFVKQDKILNKREDELYNQYYHHMNKDFNINKSSISFADIKYKNGFGDSEYIKDIYNHEIAKEKEKLKQKAKNHTKQKGKNDGIQA